MKKTYEKPVLKTEQFDAQDIITASSLDTVDTNSTGTPATWETPQIPFGI